MTMPSRSTEYRKRKGLGQVSVDLDESDWSAVMEVTGAKTKRAAAEASLRMMLDAHKRDQEWKAECARARAEALARLGENDAL